MKKIVSLFTVLVMVFSVMAVSVSAEGTLYVQSNFTTMESFTSNFHAGLYYIEDEGLLYGYNEAKCLQTLNEWFQYDTEIEVNFADDDLSDTERAYSLWYPNTNLDSYGHYDGCNYMKFGYSIENREFYLTADDIDSGEVIDLLPRVPAELEDDKFHKFGISVSSKRIRCFVNGEMIFDFNDVADDYLIGREDENTVPTALVYWNDGNFIQIKSVKIASPGYLFPYAEAPVTSETTTVGGEENKTTAPVKDPEDTTKETTTRVESSVVTKENGETEIVTEIITEKPAPAATNTGKPAGGNATATGDASFIVVAVMVATLGCALIVRKARV